MEQYLSDSASERKSLLLLAAPQPQLRFNGAFATISRTTWNGDRPQQMEAMGATPGIFSVLQVQPSLGRAYTVSEGQKGNEHVAVLMYDLWHQHFTATREF